MGGRLFGGKAKGLAAEKRVNVHQAEKSVNYLKTSMCTKKWGQRGCSVEKPTGTKAEWKSHQLIVRLALVQRLPPY